MLGTSQAPLPVSYPARLQNRSQECAGHSGTHTVMPTGKMDAQSTPGFSSHSACTLLDHPRKLRGADTAPLPTTSSPRRGSEGLRRLSRAGCRRRQGSLPAGWKPGDAKLHTPDEGLAPTRALPGERQGRGRSPLTGRGCRRAESAVGSSQARARIPTHLPRPERRIVPGK